MPVKLRLTGILALLALLSACTPTVASLDQQALENAVVLKGRSMALIDLHKSGKTYAEVETMATDLIVDLRSAESYVAAIPKNQTSGQQWAIVNEIVINYWLNQWQQYDPEKVPPTGGPGFAELQRDNIAAAFDAVICLEVNKDFAQPLKNCSAAVATAQRALQEIR